MNNYRHITKEQFFQILGDDRYRWAKKGDPELPWLEAHIDFIFDTVTNTYVGYRRTSSWNSDIDWGVVDSLIPRKILAELKRKDRKRRKSNNRVKARYRKLIRRGKHVQPTPVYVGSGLYEFMEKGNVIPYEPIGLDGIADLIEELWSDKVVINENNKSNIQG